MLKNYLLVFFISMVPIIELRGAIPIGLGMGLPVLPTYLVCVIGNMIPVPFIYLFARKFLIWGYHKPLVGPICRFCINKGEKGGRALEAKAGRGLPLALLLWGENRWLCLGRDLTRPLALAQTALCGLAALQTMALFAAR